MNEDKKIFLDELLDELSCYFDSDSEIVVEGDSIRIRERNYEYKINGEFTTTVSPVVNIDRAFAVYNEGKSVFDIALEIVRLYDDTKEGKNENIGIINNTLQDCSDYDIAKKHFSLKIVNKNNPKYERDVNNAVYYKEYPDFSIFPVIEIPDIGSALITKDMCRRWNVDVSQNTFMDIRKSFMDRGKVSVFPIVNFLEQMIARGDIDSEDVSLFDMDLSSNLVPMFVMKPNNTLFGASFIDSPDFIKEVSSSMNSNIPVDLWIILSSTHECILMPVDNNNDSQSFVDNTLSMVHEINNTLAPDDVASNSIFRYYADTNTIKEYSL